MPTNESPVSSGPDGPKASARVRGRRPPHGEPVIDRALSLLAAFDADHRSLTLGELSRRSRIPTSSALRLAARLVDWGALERDPAGQYCIGLRLLEVATLAPRGYGLRQVALPYMHDLAEVTHQHVQLAVRDGMAALLVERFSAHQATPVEYRIGGRLPLHSTGVGLALLAFAPREVQEDLLAQPMHSEPDRKPISADALRRKLAEVRRERLAVFRRQDENEAIVSVAAPVFDADDIVVGVLGVLVPTRMAQPRRLGLAVQTAARGVSRELGARVANPPRRTSL